MRTFREFITLCEQTYDKEMGQTVKKIGTGVKVGAERKKTAPERRRMKAAGGGKMVPAKDYKARKDICLLYTSPSPRDGLLSRMPSSA